MEQLHRSSNGGWRGKSGGPGVSAWPGKSGSLGRPQPGRAGFVPAALEGATLTVSSACACSQDEGPMIGKEGRKEGKKRGEERIKKESLHTNEA